MENKRPIKRKIKEGVVVSNKMQKTVTVRVSRTIKHPHFEKVIQRAKRYYAHNDKFDLPVGAKVKIMETRPLSKLKCWKVIEVI